MHKRDSWGTAASALKVPSVSSLPQTQACNVMPDCLGILLWTTISVSCAEQEPWMASCTEITENVVLQEDLQRSLRARLNVMLTEAQEAEATAGQAKHTASSVPLCL